MHRLLSRVLALVLPLIAALTLTTGPLAARAAADDGVWPVDRPADRPRVVTPFSPPAQDWLAGHRGVDLAAATGQPVRAMVAGVVAVAGPVAGTPVVVVRLPDGRRLTYQPVASQVEVGRVVSAGDVLGTVAPVGGHCGGGCLHVGLRTPSGYADPLGLLARRPAVLKPS